MSRPNSARPLQFDAGFGAAVEQSLFRPAGGRLL
jgi:hypothetical protein